MRRLAGSASGRRCRFARDMKPGHRVVVILPDSLRNYLTKFVDDRWMRQHGFLKADWELGSIADVVRALGKRTVIALDVDDKIGRATDLFKEHGISQMPVLDQGKLAGILTETDLLQALVSGKVSGETIVGEVRSARSPRRDARQLGDCPHLRARRCRPGRRQTTAASTRCSPEWTSSRCWRSSEPAAGGQGVSTRRIAPPVLSPPRLGAHGRRSVDRAHAPRAVGCHAPAWLRAVDRTAASARRGRDATAAT